MATYKGRSVKLNNPRRIAKGETVTARKSRLYMSQMAIK